MDMQTEKTGQRCRLLRASPRASMVLSRPCGGMVRSSRPAIFRIWWARLSCH